MAEKLEIYKCSVCGNIVEVLHGGYGQLVCCGQPMENLTEKTADQGKEKHVPVIEKISGGYKVKVGSIPHPMEEKHYIEWIELLASGAVYRQFLFPGKTPEAIFNIPGMGPNTPVPFGPVQTTYNNSMPPNVVSEKVEVGSVSAREYCNIHGLWKG